MYGLVLTVHILVSVLLVIAVLLQSGKGADIGAVFGGAGSQALFGSAGPADFLNKATRVLVIVFMVTSLTLGYMPFNRQSQSIMDKAATSAPAAPAKGTPVNREPYRSYPAKMPASPGKQALPTPVAPPAAQGLPAPAAPAPAK